MNWAVLGQREALIALALGVAIGSGGTYFVVAPPAADGTEECERCVAELAELRAVVADLAAEDPEMERWKRPREGTDKPYGLEGLRR